MNTCKYVQKTLLAFSVLALSAGLSAKTYELDCNAPTCSARTLAISFVNEHSSFFDFNHDDYSGQAQTDTWLIVRKAEDSAFLS